MNSVRTGQRTVEARFGRLALLPDVLAEAVHDERHSAFVLEPAHVELHSRHNTSVL